eukprot:jgi/Mesen1/7501/ME000039S06718
MNHCRRSLVTVTRTLLPSNVKEASSRGPQGRPFQTGIRPANGVLHKAQGHLKDFVGSFRQVQCKEGAFDADTCYTRPVSANFSPKENRQLQSLCSKWRHSVRFLLQTLPAEYREIHSGKTQPEPVENPHVKRVLDKLSKLFLKKKAGAGTAKVIEVLLQLHLSEKEVESIFNTNRPLYDTAFITQTGSASSLVELVDCLLAFGLTHKEVGKMFKMRPHLLSTEGCQAWGETVGYLRDELKVARLSKVLTKWPRILQSDASTKRTVVDFLRKECGMLNVVGAVDKYPSLLGMTTDSLKEKTASLRQLLGRQELGRLLDKRPNLLYVGLTVPAASFKWLTDTVGEDEARRVSSVYPQLLTCKAETLELKLGNLRTTFPTVDVLALLAREPSILSASPETIRRIHRWLCDSFGEPNAAKIVQLSPQLLHISVDILQPKAEFVTRVMGRSSAELAEVPRVLAYGLQTYLQPRYDAMRRLGLGHHFSLKKLFFSKNEVFKALLILCKEPEFDQYRRFDIQGVSKVGVPGLWLSFGTSDMGPSAPSSAGWTGNLDCVPAESGDWGRTQTLIIL